MEVGGEGGVDGGREEGAVALGEEEAGVADDGGVEVGMVGGWGVDAEARGEGDGCWDGPVGSGGLGPDVDGVGSGEWEEEEEEEEERGVIGSAGHGCRDFWRGRYWGSSALQLSTGMEVWFETWESF